MRGSLPNKGGKIRQAVAPWDEGTLRRGLHQLVEAEFLYQRGLPPQATYRFKHALIQDAAYQSLLKRTGQRHHQRIAQVLETQFPETAATQPELLAHHYTAAGCHEQAMPYWQQAGQQASNRSAPLEAISHCTTGLALLTTLPETPAHAQHALTLYLALGAALQMTQGLAAPEVEHAYTQAHTLCQQVGETPELAPVLYGLWRYYNARGQLHTARELGDALRRVGPPSPPSFAATGRPCPRTPRPPSRSRPRRALPSGPPWARVCVAGRWPGRARVKRGWPRSARGSRPGGPPEPRCTFP